MKKHLLLLSWAATAVSLVFAQGKDDFTTLTANTSYVSCTTTAGWVGNYCAVLTGGASDAMPVFTMIGSTDETKALCMNGNTTKVGSITSPILSGGCGTLTFDYGFPYSESKGVSFHVAIKQGSAVVYEFDVINTTVAKLKKASHLEEINVAGDFQIVMTNNSPTNYSGGNKDRFAVWNIAWTACGEGSVTEKVEAPTITPATGVYETAQTVTIEAGEGLSIYYTLDGTTPTTASTLYSAPFTISETTTVTAIAVNAEGKASKAVSATLTFAKGYESLAALKAAATDAKTPISFSFTELLVTGVASTSYATSVYVTDGKDGFLFYGAAPTFKKGDKISGKVEGNLYLYNGLTELDGHSWDAVSVVSSDNEVAAQVLTIADINNNNGIKTYESMLVTLKDISFASAELTSKNVTMIDEFDNEIILRDNFGIWSDLSIDVTKTYNVTAFVQSYNGTAQLYPLAASDIQIVTNLAVPTAAFAEASVVVKGLDKEVVNAFATNSDGVVTYTSSNEEVATVAADGSIKVLGYGTTVIKASVAATATYIDVVASFELVVLSAGDGLSIETALLVSDVAYYSSIITDKVWVKGYAVGYIDGSAFESGAKFELPAETQTELLIAATADETTPTNCVPVQLPKGAVRDALDLFAVPSIYKQEVWVYGNLQTYFQVPGVKNVTDYNLNGGVSAIDNIKSDATQSTSIYNLQGQRVKAMGKVGIYVVGNKKIMVK